MLTIRTFIVFISFVTVTVFAESKSPCEEGTYPGYSGEICMRFLNVSAPYRFGSRFCGIYGYEPLKAQSTEDKEYIHSLITGILKNKGEYWIGNDDNSTDDNSTSCAFLSSVTKEIQFEDCNQSKSIICMKPAYTHYLYNLDFLDSDIKNLKEVFNKFVFQYSQSMHSIEEKIQEITGNQQTMKKQLSAIRTAIENMNPGNGFVGYAENGFGKERNSRERCAEPPYISRFPVNETILAIEGSAIRLKCIASGNPKPIVQWFTKSTNIPTTGDEYPLHFISRSDAGEYICVADNKIGLPVNEKFNVDVLFRPVFKQPLTTISTHIGQFVTLTSTIDAHPKPDVSWYKDQMYGEINSSLTNTGGHTYVSKLQVQITSDHDLGMYRCVAKNSIGQSTLPVNVIGAVPNVAISTQRGADHKIFRIDSRIHSDSPVTECELSIGSQKEASITVPSKLQDTERSVRNEFNEVIKSEELDFNFKPNTNYSIQMRCKNKNGWSKYSNTVYIVTYYVCGHDLTITDNQCHYLISHSEYGKSAYISSYKCLSVIQAKNCSTIRTIVVEVDQSLKQRCKRNGYNFGSIQLKERNNPFNYICNNDDKGMVSQSDQLTLEVNKMQPDTTHGFKLCFKC